MAELRFDVLGMQVAFAGAPGAWRMFVLGADAKRRPTEFVVPGFPADDELAVTLRDLFHESASAANAGVVHLR